MVRESLNRTLGASLGDLAWLQAQLSVARGGLGLRSSFIHSSAAFLTSFLSSQHLILQMAPSADLSHFKPTDALEHLSEVLGLDQTPSLEALTGQRQKDVSTQIDEKLHTNLLESVPNTREKARLQSVQLPHAGDWLYAVPCPALGLQLCPPEFRTTVLYRLEEPLFDNVGVCMGCGTQESDRMGDHAISCGAQGERIARHNT